MPKLQITFLQLIAIATLCIIGLPAHAQDQPAAPANQQSGTFGKFEVGLPGIPKDKTIDEFLNENKASADGSSGPILAFINLAVNAVIAILVIIGLITIVIAGYIYMTAHGDGSQVRTAKEMILAALIGIFLALVSVIILNVVNRYIGSDAQEPTLGKTEGGAAGKQQSILNSQILDGSDPTTKAQSDAIRTLFADKERIEGDIRALDDPFVDDATVARNAGELARLRAELAQINQQIAVLNQ